MRRLIAEFEAQSFTQIIFPHTKSDWNPYLREAQKCFVTIITNVAQFQECLIICDDVAAVKKHFADKTIFTLSRTKQMTHGRETALRFA